MECHPKSYLIRVTLLGDNSKRFYKNKILLIFYFLFSCLFQRRRPFLLVQSRGLEFLLILVFNLCSFLVFLHSFDLRIVIWNDEEEDGHSFPRGMLMISVFFFNEFLVIFVDASDFLCVCVFFMNFI